MGSDQQPSPRPCKQEHPSGRPIGAFQLPYTFTAFNNTRSPIYPGSTLFCSSTLPTWLKLESKHRLGVGFALNFLWIRARTKSGLALRCKLLEFCESRPAFQEIYKYPPILTLHWLCINPFNGAIQRVNIVILTSVDFQPYSLHVHLKFVSCNKLIQASKSFSKFVGHRSYITPKSSAISGYLNHLCKAVQ